MNGPLQDPQRAQLRTLLNVEFYESPFRADPDNAAELERAGLWLREVADRCDVDIVHLNELCFVMLPWQARPLVHVLTRNAQPDCEAMRAAGAVVTPSRTQLNELQRVCGPLPLSAAIMAGRTTGPLSAVNKEAMIVGAGDIDDGSSGLAMLADSAAQLSWPVFLLGDAPSQATSFTNTHFLGSLPHADRLAVLARAGIFARPATAPGFSFDVLDAALSGCALVLSDVPDLREQWDGAAAFVKPNDRDSLHDALLRLMNDADARADMGNRARQQATLFSGERMGASYLAIYIELSLRASSTLYKRISGHAPLDWTA